VLIDCRRDWLEVRCVGAAGVEEKRCSNLCSNLHPGFGENPGFSGRSRHLSIPPQATKVYLAKKPTRAVGFFVSGDKQSSCPVYFRAAAFFGKLPVGAELKSIRIATCQGVRPGGLDLNQPEPAITMPRAVHWRENKWRTPLRVRHGCIQGGGATGGCLTVSQSLGPREPRGTGLKWCCSKHPARLRVNFPKECT